MKLKKLFFRSSAQTYVNEVQTWAVNWTARDGEYSHNRKPAMKIFTSETDAEAFASALRDAFKLIQHTSDTKVTIEKME